MKNLNLSITLFLSLIYFSCSAQFDCSNWALGLDFNFKKPGKALQDQGLRNMFGGNIEAYYLGIRTGDFILAPGVRFSAGSTMFKYGETIQLEFPEGATATERLSVEHGNFLGVMRFIYTKTNRLFPYAELYSGSRGTAGYERLRADQDVEGFDNTRTKIFRNYSAVHGLGLGFLYQVSGNTFINFKVANEWTKEFVHLDISAPDYYSTNTVVSNNASNLGFNIGVFVVLGCREQRTNKRSHNSYYRPKSNKKLPKSMNLKSKSQG